MFWPDPQEQQAGYPGGQEASSGQGAGLSNNNNIKKFIGEHWEQYI